MNRDQIFLPTQQPGNVNINCSSNRRRRLDCHFFYVHCSFFYPPKLACLVLTPKAGNEVPEKACIIHKNLVVSYLCN
jgi:hypothetical protein